MLKLSKFGAYTAQKLAQLGEKIAQARLQCLSLFASLFAMCWVLEGENVETEKQLLRKKRNNEIEVAKKPKLFLLTLGI